MFLYILYYVKGQKTFVTKYLYFSFTGKKLRDILKELLTLESNYEMVKLFIDFEPSITKSKYITKFLNANSDINLR